MYRSIPLHDYTINFLSSFSEVESSFNWGRYSKIFILVDENTKALCLPKLLQAVPEFNHTILIEIPSGEKHKTISTCEYIWTELFNCEADRHTLLINLGGGVIGDMGGFAAATYKRGIDFINFPTTLLSQVDATIGGKLGVDFSGFKNGVGLFQNPTNVFINIDFLKTLPDDELLSGYAEMLKHALIADFGSWTKLSSKDPFHIVEESELIYESILIKRDIVQDDPFEDGRRKILNFGHTIGHALESYALSNGDIELKHGHAVAFGMLAAAYLSHQKIRFPLCHLEAIRHYVHNLYKGHLNFDLPIDNLAQLAKNDKKNRGGQYRFVLLKDIGKPVYDVNCTEKEVIEALNYLRE